jgi:hypothetical protein
MRLVVQPGLLITSILNSFAHWYVRHLAQAIATKFDDDGRIQLRDFLAADKAAVVKAAVVKADVAQAVGRSRRPDRYAGIGDDHQGWVPQGPPIKQRFLCYDDTAIDDAAAAAGDSPGGASCGLHPRVPPMPAAFIWFRGV